MTDILVTGGTGFLGSHLVRMLRAKYRVAAVGRAFDLTDAASARECFAAHEPHIVVHLAARVGGIGANRHRPASFGAENLAMGLNVLREAERWNVERLILIGTTCSYPAECRVPFRESDLWAGYPEPTNAPYGVAKRALMSLCDAYRAQYGLAAQSLILANLYGPGDAVSIDNAHVIPALIQRMIRARLENRPSVACWGGRAAETTRDFLYVEDAARAIVRALEAPPAAEPINIGTGVETTIADVAAAIRKHVGYTGALEWDSRMPSGQPRRCLDVTRARELLGWRAEVALDDGLARTVAWYRRRALTPDAVAHEARLRALEERAS